MEGGDSCISEIHSTQEDSDSKILEKVVVKEKSKKLRCAVSASGDGFRRQGNAFSPSSGAVSAEFMRMYYGFERIKIPAEPGVKVAKIDNFKTVPGSGIMENLGRMPVISATSNGVITIQLSNNLDIDMSIEQNVRVRSPFFTSMSTASNRCTALVHESGMLLHDGRVVNGYFPANTHNNIEHNAVIGPTGIVFSSSNLSTAYYVDPDFNFTPIDSKEIDFPFMKYDFASKIFFTKCPFSNKRLERCQFWLKTATVSRMRLMRETHYQVSIGPLLVLEDTATGQVEITCPFQKILCNSKTGSIEVRNSNKICLTAGTNGMSSMKLDKKRVHVSCSGFLASEGGAAASLHATGELSCY
ncbi:unnamed protein product [Bursaphelenchus okinawaensis]|uniref:Uncharacterized protein n=1 Tax=Bursaphelenchus okinawaensis TaxID=465554 RepID=A0A811JU98_9BILA|nr:unnamed protein product [Bursaphelenchus okinawaensis]CAG9083216.1 unnamed protein product [Bursaphelenchus okinawaensis]